jgi:hypothetical protein
MPLDVPLAAAQERLLEQALDLSQLFSHRSPVEMKCVRSRIDLGRQDGHG